MPPGAGHAVLNSTTPHARRARPETSHQKAVNINRKMRIDKILYKKCARVQRKVAKRRSTLLSKAYREIKRIYYLPECFDSEDEENGVGGLVPNRDRLESDDEEDYGGEALERKKALDRAIRRLGRKDGIYIPRKPQDSKDSLKPLPGAANGSRVNQLTGAKGKGRNSSRNTSRRRSLQPLAPAETRSEILDDLDMDLLGEGPGEYDTSMDSDSDGTEPFVEHDFSYADPYATVR